MVTQPVPGLRIFGLYGVNSIGAVDMHRRLPLHGIGDVAVDIQCGCRERFRIHTACQRMRSEGVPLRYNNDKRKKP